MKIFSKLAVLSISSLSVASAFVVPAIGSSGRPSSILQAGVPVINDWKVLPDGSVKGKVRNHPTIPNGKTISTSPLKDKNSCKDNATVSTKSGSQYKLGKGQVAVQPKANGVAKATPAPQPAKVAPAKTAQKEKSLKERMMQAKKDYDLNGKTIGDGKYLLVGSLIRSSSKRSQIYYAYRADSDGLPAGPRLTVKISTNFEALERENKNYDAVNRGFFSGQFVKKLEILPEANGSRGLPNSACAIVLESGARNLRNLCDARKNVGFEGRAMRQAAVALAECVQAMHSSGLVWTDLKAENFVVTSESVGDGSAQAIKAIDLESAVPVGGPPEDFSPEACPPEFAKEFQAGRGLEFVVKYNYDIWSFGMLLYELAVGRSYFAGKNDGQITKLLNSKDGFEVDVSAVQDNKLRDLISQCLQLDPQRRPGITQVLLHPYFLTTGIGPISF